MFIKLFLFLSSFFFSSSHALASQDVCASQVCVGVVDVGSTGSRLHVYAYKDKEHPSRGIQEVWTKHVGPGFALLELNPTHTNAYLKQLFSGAPVHIPIYFYATAGMRLLSQEKQDEYYDAVKGWFSTSAWNLHGAKTITGHEEGVFAWLSAYYALNLSSDDAIQKLGVLDTGGASVQIITAVASMDAAHANNYSSVQLEGRTIILFVNSFLGLGRSLMTQQFLNDPMCYPEGYELPDTLVGKGDASICSQHVEKLVNGVHSVNKVVQPVLDSEPPKNWYVIGGLYHTAKSSYMKAIDSITSTYLLEQANEEICQQNWSVVKQHYPGEYELFQACLTASYYHALLTGGYGLAPEEPIHFLPENAISNWTLGVVLHQD
jgi:hypothetical protein